MIGFLAFLFNSILWSCLVFVSYRAKYLQASESSRYITTILLAMLSAVIATIIFQVVNCIIVGYLDPFFLMVFIIGLVLSFTISLIVGFLFLPSEEKKTKP